MLSIICPIYNEEKYIVGCIDSILKQDYPRNDWEVLFVDGMSTDRTREIVQDYCRNYDFIRLIDNPQKIVPHAMNKGISVAKGDVIIRLDAHALYKDDYCSVLTKQLKALGADNVGAVCKTDVQHKTSKTLAIREVLSNKFGVGNSVFRVGADRAMEVDTVPFGCWRRDVFDKYGLFDVRLVRNQDIEFNKRILRGGGKIYIVPDTYCVYLARETFKALALNCFQNGKWNVLTVHYTKQFDSLSLRHFVPMLFVCSLIAPLFVGMFYSQTMYVSLASMLMYLFSLMLICGRLSYAKKLNIFYLLSSFLVLHFSYGCGSIAGLWSVLWEKSNK